LDFFHALNRHRSDPFAVRLANASEATDTVAGHVGLVGQRIGRLCHIEPAEPVDRTAAEFVRDELEPAWKRLEQRLAPGGCDGATERCLSPSDFGFHNALCEPNGRFRFIDFEYAGWDDPARMVCDFFCQPAVPVPLTYFDRFIRSVAAIFPDPECV